jgi:DNA invertase Pin-like site-specific DNA recombinase
MRVGYARVSTAGQHTDGQEARLREARCEVIYTDHGVTGKAASRPEWDKCLAHLRAGDVLVTVKLDRIGRSLINLIDTVNLLGARKVDLVVLDQAIDTTTPNGKLLFHILGALAEWEATLIGERTREGLAAARERHGGQLPKRGPTWSEDQARMVRELYAARDSNHMTVERIGQVVGVSRRTVYRIVGAGQG